MTYKEILAGRGFGLKEARQSVETAYTIRNSKPVGLQGDYHPILKNNIIMYNKLINKETKLSVIGLGYVGLPIALEFAKQIKVVGFDIKPERVELMKKGIDPSNELTSEAFKNTDIVLTSDPSELKTASFHIIAVPYSYHQDIICLILHLFLKHLKQLAEF